MNRKKRSLILLTSISASVISIVCITSNMNMENATKGLHAEDYISSGNHYARRAPTENESGVKEYYVSCDDHRHYVLEEGKMYFRGIHYSNASCIQIIIANYTSTFNNGNNFLATDSSFNINQTDSTVSQAGWFSQGFVDGKYRLLTPSFASAAVDNQVWVIKADSLLTDSEGEIGRAHV